MSDMGLTCSSSDNSSSGGEEESEEPPIGMAVDSDVITLSWKQWLLKRKQRAIKSDFVCHLDSKTYRIISSVKSSMRAEKKEDSPAIATSSACSDSSTAVSSATSAMSLPESSTHSDPAFVLFDFDDESGDSATTKRLDPDELDIDSGTHDTSDSSSMKHPIKAGPFSDSCWLIENRLAFGALPDQWDEVQGLMQSGITHIVCLVEFNDPFELYGSLLQAWLDRSAKSKADKSRIITVMHFPIHDFQISEHTPMIGLVQSLSEILLNDPCSVVYIHCLGGHGRSGTVSIHLMSALSAQSSVIRTRMPDFQSIREYLKCCHDCGRFSSYCGRWCRIPESRNQKDQCVMLRQYLCPGLDA